MRVESTRRHDGSNGLSGCALLLTGAMSAGLSCTSINSGVMQETIRLQSVATVLGNEFKRDAQRRAFADWWESGAPINVLHIRWAANNPLYADCLEYVLLLEAARGELRTGEYEKAQLLLMLGFERIKGMPFPPGSMLDYDLCRGLLRGVAALRNGACPDVEFSVLPRLLSASGRASTSGPAPGRARKAPETVIEEGSEAAGSVQRRSSASDGGDKGED